MDVKILFCCNKLDNLMATMPFWEVLISRRMLESYWASSNFILLSHLASKGYMNLALIFDGNIFVCGNLFDVGAKIPHKMKLLLDKNFFIWFSTEQIYNTKYVLENRTYKPIIIYGLEHLYSMNTIMAISWEGWNCTNIGNLWEGWKQDNCAMQPLNIEILISTCSNMHFGNFGMLEFCDNCVQFNGMESFLFLPWLMSSQILSFTMIERFLDGILQN